jgi:hypothetical protein
MGASVIVWGVRAATRVTGGGHGFTAAAPRVALRDEYAACLVFPALRVRREGKNITDVRVTVGCAHGYLGHLHVWHVCE